MRPSSNASWVRSSDASGIAQFGREPRFFDQAPGLQSIIARHKEAAWKSADRPLNGAHVAIRHQNGNLGLFEQGLDKADQDDVVGSNEFHHPLETSASHPHVAAHQATCHGAGIIKAFPAPGKGEQVGVVVPFDDKHPGQSGLEGLISLVAGDMERVNAMILSRTGSDVTMIPEVANHLISSGGKRLRPMLTLATAALAGYRGDGQVKLAASVEFMHTATLLHDDVVDESDMRRGRVAARVKWGNEASVLVGDFLLGQAFKMMVEVGNLRALEILSSAAAVIAEGEVMQLAAAKNTESNEDEYLAVIRAKTAELFGAACEVGPVIAGCPKAEQAACRSYGVNLGIAFQLVDDALDYGGVSAKLGKNVGDDFREGKITLPVVLSFRRGDDAERAFWKRTLEQGETEDRDLDHALAIMRRHRALDDTLERARHYGAIARDALALFPKAPMKQALLDAVDFCIARAH
jgi:octaprenyl-diphosphate synthase